MSSNALCISRLDNGQIMANFSRMQGENPGVLGNFYGDSALVFGSDDYGIDAEIELIHDWHATGKIIKIQVRSSLDLKIRQKRKFLLIQKHSLMVVEKKLRLMKNRKKSYRQH